MKGIAVIMAEILALSYNQKTQYFLYVGLSISVMGLVVITYFSNPHVFHRFLGSINPFAAFFLVFILGFVIFSFFLSRGWFAIYQPEHLTGLIRASALATFLGIIIILVDLKIVFPADTNVLLPESLAFYPAIAFLVEILFHLLPLAVFLISLTAIFKQLNFEIIIWICILLVALLEPIYQTIPMSSSPRYAVWAVVYVGLHLYLFNLTQLYLFKRYDFVSMYAFRLVYYLLWHILWGNIRLSILF